MNKTLPLLLAVALAVAGAAAVAQDTGSGDQPPPRRAARAEKAKAELEKRFAQADANQDGKLSREEAKDKMPKVYEHFDEIDSGKSGFVTLAQVMSAMRKMAAEKRQKH
jgi:Ca2+-binding EF-hand superfamily protein